MAMKVGLIGLGRHGARYAQHLLNSQAPGQLVAICRRDVAQGQAYAQEHHLHFHHHYQSLIKDPAVEGIIVVTPPSLTQPIAMEAIQNGKPLLIEKPLAISVEDARHIVQQATEANVPIMTAHTLRYDTTIVALKERSQEVGKWQYLSLTARLERRQHSPEEINAWNGRGALMEVGIHLLDIARFLTGEEIYEVYCERTQTAHAGPEDQIWGRLTTQSGIPCLLDVSRVSHSRTTKIELIGETGQLSANWSTSTLSLQRQRNPPVLHTFSSTPTICSVLKGFFRAIRTGEPMPITGKDGLRAIEIAEACYESAVKKHPITLPHS